MLTGPPVSPGWVGIFTRPPALPLTAVADVVGVTDGVGVTGGIGVVGVDVAALVPEGIIGGVVPGVTPGTTG